MKEKATLKATKVFFSTRWMLMIWGLVRPPDRAWDSYPPEINCALKRRHTDRTLEGATHPASGSGCTPRPDYKLHISIVLKRCAGTVCASGLYDMGGLVQGV